MPFVDMSCSRVRTLASMDETPGRARDRSSARSGTPTEGEAPGVEALAGLDKELCKAVLAEMVAAFQAAPPPSTVALEEVTRAGLAAAEARAVMFGWTNRVLRTAQSVLLLQCDGFAAEAAPLVRSMLEHAMALHWLLDQPGDAFQALVRARQHEVRKLRETQQMGWQMSDDIQTLMGELLAIETDGSRSADHLLATKHHAQCYDLGALYQAWLVETWSSHASLSSANDYFESQGDSDFVLLLTPREPLINLPAICVAAALTALDAYDRVLANAPLSDNLADWGQRVEPREA